MLQGTSLAVQWLRLCASNAGDSSLIPAWGLKILHAMWLGPKVRKRPFKTRMKQKEMVLWDLARVTAQGPHNSQGRGDRGSSLSRLLLAGKTAQQSISFASLKQEPGGPELGGRQHITCCSGGPTEPPVPLGPET